MTGIGTDGPMTGEGMRYLSDVSDVPETKERRRKLGLKELVALVSAFVVGALGGKATTGKIDREAFKAWVADKDPGAVLAMTAEQLKAVKNPFAPAEAYAQDPKKALTPESSEKDTSPIPLKVTMEGKETIISPKITAKNMDRYTLKGVPLSEFIKFKNTRKLRDFLTEKGLMASFKLFWIVRNRARTIIHKSEIAEYKAETAKYKAETAKYKAETAKYKAETDKALAEAKKIRKETLELLNNQ